MLTADDNPSLWCLSVAVDPPAQIDYSHWPCPACGRTRPLRQMRAVEFAYVARATRRLLLCLDCVAALRAPGDEGNAMNPNWGREPLDDLRFPRARDARMR